MKTRLILTGLALLTAWALPARASYYSTVVLADNPVGYWRMNETTGTSASNWVNVANAGTYRNGTAAATGAPAPILAQAGPRPATFPGFESDNNSVYFHGETDATFSATTTDNLNIPTTGLNSLNYTFEVWFFNSRPTSERIITGYLGGRAAAAGSPQEMIGIGGNGFHQGKLFFITGGGSPLVGTTTLALDTWYHAAYVRDGSTVSLYLNGVLEASGTRAATISATDQLVRLGITPYGEWSFKGRLDELAVYNHALSASQILAHYNAAFTMVPEPSTMLLLGVGGALAWRRLRRRSTT